MLGPNAGMEGTTARRAGEVLGSLARSSVIVVGGSRLRSKHWVVV